MGQAIELTNLPGREVHHECENGLIIGKQGRQISREKAYDQVFGFVYLLDLTVRGKEECVMRKAPMRPSRRWGRRSSPSMKSLIRVTST